MSSRYCATGEDKREIVEWIGRRFPCADPDLRKIAEWIGRRFPWAAPDDVWRAAVRMQEWYNRSAPEDAIWDKLEAGEISKDDALIRLASIESTTPVNALHRSQVAATAATEPDAFVRLLERIATFLGFSGCAHGEVRVAFRDVFSRGHTVEPVSTFAVRSQSLERPARPSREGRTEAGRKRRPAKTQPQPTAGTTAPKAGFDSKPTLSPVTSPAASSDYAEAARVIVSALESAGDPLGIPLLSVKTKMEDRRLRETLLILVQKGLVRQCGQGKAARYSPDNS